MYINIDTRVSKRRHQAAAHNSLLFQGETSIFLSLYLVEDLGL